MNFSTNSTGYKQNTLFEIIDRFKILEMDGLEIWTGHIDQYLESDSLDKLKKRLKRIGLRVPCIAGYFDLISSEEIAKNSLNRINQYVEVAAELECPVLRVFFGEKPALEMTDKDWDLSRRSFFQAIQYAEFFKVKIAVEIHGGTPCDSDNSCLRLIDSLKPEKLYVIFDGFNIALRGGHVEKEMHNLKSNICHFHFKNCEYTKENNRITSPVFRGLFEIEPILSAIARSDYNRFITIEYFGWNNFHNIRQSLHYLRNYFMKTT